MFDIENPILKRLLAAVGALADFTALYIIFRHSESPLKAPWWAIPLFVLGIVMILVFSSPPGDFRILVREVLVDIKSWGDVGGTHHDALTTYRVEKLRCRKPRARFLVYDAYVSDGQRTSTDVINYDFKEEPKPLNANAKVLKIDLGPACRYLKKYTVISRCEYQDTFSNPKTEFYEISVSYPTRRLSVRVLLPENKPCSNAWVTKQTGATTETESSQPDISDNKRVITWNKRTPNFNSTYQIYWDW